MPLAFPVSTASSADAIVQPVQQQYSRASAEETCMFTLQLIVLQRGFWRTTMLAPELGLTVGRMVLEVLALKTPGWYCLQCDEEALMTSGSDVIVSISEATRKPTSAILTLLSSEIIAIMLIFSPSVSSFVSLIFGDIDHALMFATGPSVGSHWC